MGPSSCPETSVTTDQRRVTFQKSDDVIYTEAKDWNPRMTFVKIWKTFVHGHQVVDGLTGAGGLAAYFVKKVWKLVTYLHAYLLT